MLCGDVIRSSEVEHNGGIESPYPIASGKETNI